MMGWTRQWRRVCGLWVLCNLALVLSPGCLLPYLGLLRGDCFARLLIKGRLLDADTLEPLSDVVIGTSIERDGELIDAVRPVRSDGTPNLPPPDAGGSFSVQGASSFGPCPARAAFPVPDVVQLTIIRGNCTEVIEIDLTGDSATHDDNDRDSDPSTDIYTLTEPVLVSPCVE